MTLTINIGIGHRPGLSDQAVQILSSCACFERLKLKWKSSSFTQAWWTREQEVLHHAAYDGFLLLNMPHIAIAMIMQKARTVEEGARLDLQVPWTTTRFGFDRILMELMVVNYC